MRTCLLTDRVGVDVKTPYRAGVRGEGLVALFREAIRLKPASHDLVPEGGTAGLHPHHVPDRRVGVGR